MKVILRIQNDIMDSWDKRVWCSQQIKTKATYTFGLSKNIRIGIKLNW
ncbi:hypothetical protein [Leptospira ellinghausenii]|nr:hypothetical protein [Leptospira ellinghausenii]